MVARWLLLLSATGAAAASGTKAVACCDYCSSCCCPASPIILPILVLDPGSCSSPGAIAHGSWKLSKGARTDMATAMWNIHTDDNPFCAKHGMRSLLPSHKLGHNGQSMLKIIYCILQACEQTVCTAWLPTCEYECFGNRHTMQTQ